MLQNTCNEKPVLNSTIPCVRQRLNTWLDCITKKTDSPKRYLFFLFHKTTQASLPSRISANENKIKDWIASSPLPLKLQWIGSGPHNYREGFTKKTIWCKLCTPRAQSEKRTGFISWLRMKWALGGASQRKPDGACTIHFFISLPGSSTLGHSVP